MSSIRSFDIQLLERMTLRGSNPLSKIEPELVLLPVTAIHFLTSCANGPRRSAVGSDVKQQAVSHSR